MYTSTESSDFKYSVQRLLVIWVVEIMSSTNILVPRESSTWEPRERCNNNGKNYYIEPKFILF